MTAPGQEPDQAASPTRGTDAPDLSGIGDNHMPEDMRREAHEVASDRPQVDDASVAEVADVAEPGPADAEQDDSGSTTPVAPGAGEREVADPDRVAGHGRDQESLSDPGRSGG
jgi:hypothetical protein